MSSVNVNAIEEDTRADLLPLCTLNLQIESKRTYDKTICAV